MTSESYKFDHFAYKLLVNLRSAKNDFQIIINSKQLIILIHYSLFGASDSALMLTLCALQMLVLLLLFLVFKTGNYGISVFYITASDLLPQMNCIPSVHEDELPVIKIS